MNKIGVLFSLTGTTSVTEKGQYQAALFALEEHNRHAKQRSDLAEFYVRDIKSDPEQTYQYAKELVKLGVKIFIGTYSSACRKAILPLLEAHEGLLIYPALYEGHEIHPNVFYTGEVPNQQVFPLLNYIKNHFGNNIYLIGSDYIYPTSTNNEVKKYWKSSGCEIVGEKYVPLGHTHFSEILQDIQTSKTQAIFSTLVGESVISFYRAFKVNGLNPKRMPIFSPITKETEVKAIGAQYAEGHYSGGSYFQSLDLKENDEFVYHFKRQFGQEVAISSVMFNTYLGTRIVLEKLTENPFLGSESFLASLSDHHFYSPSGIIRIEKENHHLSRSIRIGKINRQGQFTIVWDSKKLISAKPFNQSYSEPLKEPKTIHWGTLFKDLILHNDKAVVLLNEQDEILYANKLAIENLSFYEGQTISPVEVQDTNSHYNVTTTYPDVSHSFKMLIFTERDNVTIPRQLFTFDLIKTYQQNYHNELTMAEAAANSSANVLILGETGCGKEVMAQAIHRKSARKNGPFIAINAGAIPRELIHSELFGFVDGAFTGAKKGGKAGKFELADKGTLFLDEIGEMPLDLQISLLRVLETRCVTRIGDHKERKIDVRIIAATNRNLQEEIAYQGTFRSDLFYRLNVLTVKIPPLRERIDDIKLLIKDFLDMLHEQYEGGPLNISEETFKLLRSYSWPGNIRELRNIIERSYLLAKSRGDRMIETLHLPAELKKSPKNVTEQASLSLAQIEKETIKKALQSTDNISNAARSLGVSRSTLYRKMKALSI